MFLTISHKSEEVRQEEETRVPQKKPEVWMNPVETNTTATA